MPQTTNARDYRCPRLQIPRTKDESAMKPEVPLHPAPADAAARKAVAPVICYPVESLPHPDLSPFRAARQGWAKVAEVLVPARDARSFDVPAGHFFRITSVDGPQVGDLNLWHAADVSERFFSGKTRALHGTHLSAGDRMWSCLPYLRQMALITEDTLDWYGFDGFGGGVHDVIGTRCDPYTHNLLTGGQYHHCCHSNLTRAFALRMGVPLSVAEFAVHDVLIQVLGLDGAERVEADVQGHAGGGAGDCGEEFVGEVEAGGGSGGASGDVSVDGLVPLVIV